MNPFVAGQRVVCICNSATRSGVITLEIGRVYTVKSAHAPGVVLEEVAPPAPMIGYLWHKFRPVNEARLDVFRRMLAPTPEREVETV